MAEDGQNVSKRIVDLQKIFVKQGTVVLQATIVLITQRNSKLFWDKNKNCLAIFILDSLNIVSLGGKPCAIDVVSLNKRVLDGNERLYIIEVVLITY